MTEHTWKEGDWVIFDRRIVQITEIRERGSCSVSDGSINTFGDLLDRLRPLTLENKRKAEYFDYYYRELYKIRGHGGFNYPDISSYFDTLMLRAIDSDEKDRSAYEDASEFVKSAHVYEPIIQGIHLFRAI